MNKPDPAALARQIQDRKLPPVESWDPPLSGEMDLRIARDGRWYHQGRVIERESLVRLFATILRRDDDGCYYLLTPVEKWRIRVDDAPFVAVLLDVCGAGEAQTLCFQTNLGDRLVADDQHPIEVEYSDSGEPSPYLQVRARLRALIARAVFLELAELAVEKEGLLGVWSRGCFFSAGTRWVNA